MSAVDGLRRARERRGGDGVSGTDPRSRSRSRASVRMSRAARRAPAARTRRLDRRQRQRPGARLRPLRDQALGCRLRRAHPDAMVLCDLEGRPSPGSRQRACAVVGHRRPRVRLPAHARRRRRRAHPLAVRHGVGRPPPADPVRHHRHGRRVRRARSRSPRSRSSATSRSVGHRRHAHRPPLARRAARQPRRVHDRQGRDATRSRPPSCARTRPGRCTSPTSSAPRSRSRGERSTRCSTATRTSTDKRPKRSHVMGRNIVPDLGAFEVWFLTGSQTLYGDEVLGQVAAQSQQVVAMLDEAPTSLPRRVEAGPHLPRRDPAATIREANAASNVVGIITWMHTFSPAKMWIAGLCALDKPMLHLHTQANSALPWGDDRLRLHEPQPGRPRRPRVRLHRDPPRHRPHDRRRARLRPHGHLADRRLVPRRGRAGGTRHMSVARFGDNMRYVAVTEGDKTEAEAIFGSEINTWGVMDLGDAGRVGHRRADRRADRGVPRPVRRRPSLRPAPVGTTRCAMARRSRSGCGSSSRRAASRPSPRRSRTSARFASYPASPCSG